MKNVWNQFQADDSGATALEYGLIAALIAVVILVAVRSLGSNLNVTFDAISKNLATANKSAK